MKKTRCTLCLALTREPVSKVLGDVGPLLEWKLWLGPPDMDSFSMRLPICRGCAVGVLNALKTTPADMVFSGMLEQSARVALRMRKALVKADEAVLLAREAMKKAMDPDRGKSGRRKANRRVPTEA